uniref:Cysteine-rich protein n=1 Tax=Hyaloperonospora parasitica TaxID=123356 RepID=Q6UB54_9STRA|nr:unknown [Hyaloperonospora parasitica]
MRIYTSFLLLMAATGIAGQTLTCTNTEHCSNNPNAHKFSERCSKSNAGLGGLEFVYCCGGCCIGNACPPS